MLQPNVVISGGFTQCIKIAGLAAAFNVPIANGGAWSFHNMHLHAGLANGGLVEHHYLAVELCRQIYTGLPEPKDGWLDLPEAPGLGFALNRDAIRELARLPLSQRHGERVSTAYSVISRITRHGLPAANTPSGMSRVTTLPAPMTAREPILTPGR